MGEVIYRQIKTSDYKQIEEIINESFELYKYIENPKILKTFLKKYLQSCLAEQTFNCIAERDQDIIGIIFGNSKSEYMVWKHIKPILMTGWYSLLMEVQAISSKEEGIEDYKKINKVYNNLLANCGKKFDGVLTLFAVTSNSRGIGLGKTLVGKFCDYLKSINTNEIYLYTDSSCNFGFYDSQGFNRIGTQNIQLKKGYEQVNMGVYLYEYILKK